VIGGRDRITFGFTKHIQPLLLVHHVSHRRSFQTMSNGVTPSTFLALATNSYRVEIHLTDETNKLRL
jgi:hypothetical protein